MDDRIAHYRLLKESSGSRAQDLVKEMSEGLPEQPEDAHALEPGEGERLDPASDNRSEIFSPSSDNFADYEKKPPNDKGSMGSSLPNDFARLPPSAKSQPTTQIINRAGTINIHYNIYQPVVTSDNEEDSFAADPDTKRGNEARVSTPTPTRACQPSPRPAPSPIQSAAAQVFVTPDDTFLRHIDQPSTKGRYPITRSWAISDMEKAKLKDSIDLMFTGTLSRRNLHKQLKNLAEAIRNEKWDEKQQAYIPINLGPDSSPSQPGNGSSGSLVSPSFSPSECIDTMDSTTGGPDLSQAKSFMSTLSTFTEASSQANPSKFRIDLSPYCQEIPTIPGDFGGADGNKIDEDSNQTVVRKQMPTIKQPTLAQELDANIATAAAACVAETKNTETNHMDEASLASVLKGVNSAGKTPPKVVNFELPGDDETSEESPQDYSSSSQSSSSKGTESDHIHGSQSPIRFESLKRSFTSPVTAARNHQYALRARPFKAACTANLEAPLNTNPAQQLLDDRQSIGTDSGDGADVIRAPNTMVNKPRPKRHSTQAEESQQNTDALACRTTSGLHVVFHPSSESRKCHLCKTMFTDESNARQADGGGPCSFHPGVLEKKKTGQSTMYAFSCCGGPPIMAGPGLVAINLVSPGCTKCYHQDKERAWNLETLTMKDPVLFEE
ncbi:hypothetical protein N0V93_007968 [Gnomoniopsis smithogilvyi]|uniref:Uncharacterized protein n=1 Tax=Gnomoniopsis smithogilvyi TaxID=1191159 RepID=A0A9W9CUB6_9PEZI|nr:hypothetical protein N0V93_007968 [Gnomoniopsis smithogilvyi]